MSAVCYGIAAAIGVVVSLITYLTSEEPYGFVVSGVWLGLASVYISLALKEFFDFVKKRRAERRAEKLKKARADTYDAAMRIMVTASAKICDECSLKEMCKTGRNVVCKIQTCLVDATREEIEKIYTEEK